MNGGYARWVEVLNSTGITLCVIFMGLGIAAFISELGTSHGPDGAGMIVLYLFYPVIPIFIIGLIAGIPTIICFRSIGKGYRYVGLAPLAFCGGVLVLCILVEVVLPSL